jgi:hypothetical protein
MKGTCLAHAKFLKFSSKFILTRKNQTACGHPTLNSHEQGESSHVERIMTALATWEQKGLNSLQMLTEKLAS